MSHYFTSGKNADLLNGEQEFRYGMALCAGDTVAVRAWVDDRRRREGRHGAMTVVTLASEGENQRGEMVFRGRSTLVLRDRPGSTASGGEVSP